MSVLGLTPPTANRYVRKSVARRRASTRSMSSRRRSSGRSSHRYVEQRESIVQIARALSEQGVPTRTGTPRWGSSTIWAILRTRLYRPCGLRPPTRDWCPSEADARDPPAGEAFRSLRLRARRPEHWLRIPVPALIKLEGQHALAQELLARNSRLSPRNTRKVSLLQGILVCRECGHSYYRSSTRSKAGNVHHYYRCSGADSFRRPEGRVCAARHVRIEADRRPARLDPGPLALLANPAADPGRDRATARSAPRRAPSQPPPRRPPSATSAVRRTRCGG